MNQTEPDPSNRFARNRKKTIALMVVLSFMAVDFGGAYIYKKITGGWFGLRLGPTEYRVPSPYFHHGFAPNVEVDQARWGSNTYRICTNSLGFRDRAVREIDLHTNRRRIVLLGDSFLEGIGVDYERSFAGLIEAELTKEGIEVLNAGVASYSPIIYWKKMRYLIESAGLEFDELFVFLDLSDAYDEMKHYDLGADGSIVDLEPADRDQGSMRERLGTLIRTKTIMLSSLVGLFDQKPDAEESEPVESSKEKAQEDADDQSLAYVNPKSIWTMDADLYFEFGQPGMKKMELSMNRLLKLLRAHAIPMTVVIYPWPDQIRFNDLAPDYVAFWEAWREKNDVPLLNLFPDFIAGKDAEERKRMILDHFITRDVHWNEKGHALVARRLIDYIQSRSPK